MIATLLTPHDPQREAAQRRRIAFRGLLAWCALGWAVVGFAIDAIT